MVEDAVDDVAVSVALWFPTIEGRCAKAKTCDSYESMRECPDPIVVGPPASRVCIKEAQKNQRE